jgi:chromosome partitioning protein
MQNLRQLNGVVLIDAPGNLAQQGLIPLFVQSDYVVCPYQYETTSINSTVTFLGFILQLKKRVQSMVTKIFFVVNKHDKRYGTEREKKLWEDTDAQWAKYGIVTPKIEQRVEMQRYNTMGLMDTQKAIVTPAFDCIYDNIFGEHDHGTEKK